MSLRRRLLLVVVIALAAAASGIAHVLTSTEAARFASVSATLDSATLALAEPTVATRGPALATANRDADETGVGKKLVARAIHENGERSAKRSWP